MASNGLLAALKRNSLEDPILSKDLNFLAEIAMDLWTHRYLLVCGFSILQELLALVLNSVDLQIEISFSS